MADYIDREKLLKSIPSVKNDKTISLFGAVADMICRHLLPELSTKTCPPQQPLRIPCTKLQRNAEKSIAISKSCIRATESTTMR